VKAPIFTLYFATSGGIQIKHLITTKMKKKLIIPGFMIIITGLTLASCNNVSEKKVEDAKENVMDAKQDLQAAQNKYSEEWQKFKNDFELKITDNDNKIGLLKVKSAKKKGEAKNKFDEKIAELEHKNQNMRDNLADYKDEGSESWETFKKRFHDDMEDFEKSMKEID
jgi:lipopolysaccharide export LptBFGC system permease protein LptF